MKNNSRNRHSQNLMVRFPGANGQHSRESRSQAVSRNAAMAATIARIKSTRIVLEGS
jgi:hypothetical protein